MIQTERSKPIVLFIDDNQDFLNRRRAMECLDLSTGQRFGAKYEIKCERVNANNWGKRTEHILNLYRPRSVFAVFVDIVLSEYKEDESGMKVAQTLYEKWPAVPIILYTAWGETKRDSLALASMRFDGSLDGRGFPKESYATFAIDQYDRLLESAHSKKVNTIENLRNNLSQHYLSLQVKVSFSEHSDARLSRIQRDVIMLLAAQRYEAKEIGEVVLAALAPGFSGSYVFKAILDGGIPRTQVLKIDEDPLKLERELRGHDNVEMRTHFPLRRLPVFFDPKQVTRLAKDWWGLVAMSYQDGSDSLLRAFGRMDSAAVESFFQSLWGIDGLRHLYSGISLSDCRPSDLLDRDEANKIETVLMDMRRHEVAVAERMPALKGLVSRLETTVRTWGTEAWSISTLRVATSSFVHGDLNCRNILVPPDPSEWVLIDFPCCQPGHLAIDFAKAEIELLGIVLDWNPGKDIDLNRIPAWDDLASILSSQMDVPAPAGDAELEKVAQAIRIIRRRFMEIHVSAEDAQKDYLLHVAVYALKALRYRDITVAKRFFLGRYALLLIATLNR